MDFKQIEAFVNVARFKSFSKAGEAIFLSQSTVSIHINTLESELGMTLFDRSGKDVQLTPAGYMFYEYALNMLNIRNEAIYSMAEFYNKIQGTLYVASSTTPCKCVLPKLITEFSKVYPEVLFKVWETSSGEVINNILKFDAEIGIVGNKSDDNRLTYSEIGNDNLVLITPSNQRFNNMEGDYIDFEDVIHESFILREESSATRKVFEGALSCKGYNINKLKIFSEVTTLDTALQFVRCGLGVTVMSECGAKEYINLGLVKRFYIKDMALDRKIYMVKYNKRTLSPAAKAFYEFAAGISKKVCKE